MDKPHAPSRSHLQRSARLALEARAKYRANPHKGTLARYRDRSLAFRRMMAKARAANGRPTLRGAARSASEARLSRAFAARDEAWRSHYLRDCGW